MDPTRILGIYVCIRVGTTTQGGARYCAFKAASININRARDQGVRSSGHSDPEDVFWYCNVCIKYQAEKGVAASLSLGAVY